MNSVKEGLEKIFTRGENLKSPRWWLLVIILVAFFIIFALGLIGIIVFEVKYKYDFFPGSRIGNISLEGLKKEEALNLITPIVSEIETGGIKIKYGDESFSLTAIDSFSSTEYVRELYSFDEYATIYNAFELGHSNNFLRNIKEQWQLFWGGKKFKAIYTLDEEAVKNLLKSQFGKFEVKAQQAWPEVVWEENSFEVIAREETMGKTFDYDQALVELKKKLSLVQKGEIILIEKVTVPEVKLADVQARKGDVEYVIASSVPQFVYGEKNWKMDKKKFARMLEFNNNDITIDLNLNKDLFEKWFKENISTQIDIEPKSAQLEMKDGNLQKISAHQEGLKADIDKARSDANSKLLAVDWPVTVNLNKVQPEVMTDNINDLGIKEIIGIGESSFAGSPANRIHNIKNGANKIHGMLIKPGEEFSLITALGEIEASTGYKAELVIKGNKTIPEYGGGLCQIGTTVFRAAMGSGLPITERRNHSYSVSYYLEDGLPGVDATIYIPHPDVRFVNDTGKHVLIQAKVEGSKVKFEFWGTKDGRKAERTKPKVWDWVSPPLTKYIETAELKPGEKKCTESAHKGVKASFDYIVTLANGEVKKQNFYSVYKPWQAVCLIGVEAEKKEVVEEENVPIVIEEQITQ